MNINISSLAWFVLEMYIFVTSHDNSYSSPIIENESSHKASDTMLCDISSMSISYISKLNSNHNTNSASKTHICTHMRHPSYLCNETIRNSTRNGDTGSQNDIVREQYSSLPYPAVSEEDLFAEKNHYGGGLWNIPYKINRPIGLEQINHFLYNGGNAFK